MKTKIISALGSASLALFISSCSSAVNTTANNSAANATNKSNTAVVVNSNQTTKSTSPVSNTTTATNGNAAVNKTSRTAAPTEKSEGEKIQGELQTGKTESVILYFGEESGDYAGYCFDNDSEAGQAILAACNNKERCEIVAEIDGAGGCKVPGLEADLSASGKIIKIESVKSLGRKK